MASNGFILNLTSKVTLPDVDYINELAAEKNFRLSRSFINPPKILEDLYFLFKKENSDPINFDVNNYLFTTEYIEKNILFRELTPEEHSYYTYTLLFLEQLEYDAVIGITPLDKALNVLMYVTMLSKKTNPSKGECDSANTPNPGVTDIKNEEALSEAIQDVSENGVSGDDSENGRNNNSDGLSKNITKCVRDHLYDLSPSISHIYGKKRPTDVPINRRILSDIKVKAYLENTQGLTTALETKKVRNNDSHENENIIMETHNQITKINKADMLKVGFDDKFIKKELIVKEKVKPESKKQILYMLLDDSGSMACLAKQTYVRAVLLNRLEQVVDGKSELKFCLYESKRYQHYDVKTLADTQKLFKEISLRRPNGGGTNIGAVLQETIDEIHALPNYHDPEIMIVCDGDDHVRDGSIDYKGVTISAVLLGRANPAIKKITQETGGFCTIENLYGHES